jgi:NADH:ubiquinone oxidoreductase subunit 6 (subunit J)
MTGDRIQDVIFGLLALATVGSALKVVMTRSIVHAAFWLFPVFAGVAGLYLVLGAQFLAAIQVLIYIGAILVLIVFAVTLTRNAGDSDVAQTNQFALPVTLAAAILAAALVNAARLVFWPPTTAITPEMVPVAPGVMAGDVAAIGMSLLQEYLLPFEIASVLLLAAMVGAIVLARKDGVASDSATAATPTCCDAPEKVEVPR